MGAPRHPAPGAPRPPPRLAYLFGAVCPERAVGAALVLPYADAAATGLHLAEIGRHVTPGAHGVVGATGLAGTRAVDLVIPENLTLLPLPPTRRVEPGRERVGVPAAEQARPSRLAGLRGDRRDLCEAWNWLAAAPDRLASITRREWANRQ